MRMVLLRALRSAGRLVERSDVLFCFTVQRKDRLPKSMPMSDEAACRILLVRWRLSDTNAR
jgi:hypothetical protein